MSLTWLFTLEKIKRNAGRRTVPAQFVQRRVTIKPRHQDIANNQIGSGTAHHLQARLAVFGVNNIKPFEGEARHNAFPDFRRVFNDQNLGHH